MKASRELSDNIVPTLGLDCQVSLSEALLGRMSCRAFLPDEVSKETIEQILALASRAPSGSNIQPWRVYVLQGESRKALSERVCSVYDACARDPAVAATHVESYSYYPQEWFSPYIDRRRENGWGLYSLLGIGRHEKERMLAQSRRNFEFFDAPVGLIFTIHRRLERGSMLDYGMFLQSIMLAARGFGLATCAQAAWLRFHRVVLPFVGASQEDEVLLCGMSLGVPDDSAKVNAYHTPRKPVADFATWLA